jgi:hypothetical protein
MTSLKFKWSRDTYFHKILKTLKKKKKKKKEEEKTTAAKGEKTFI